MTSARMNALIGRHFAGLEHHGVAGGQGRGHLQGDLVQRVVPGRDAADDADGLAHDQRVADLLLELVAAEHLGGDGEVGLRQAGLDEVAEEERHADFLGDGAGDLVGAGLEAGVDLHQVGGALFLGQCAPGGEGGLGGGDGRVDVGGGAFGDGGDHFFGGRIGDGERVGAGGWHPLAVDVQLLVCSHGATIGRAAAAATAERGGRGC
jgi:hypothetical protein